MADQDWQARPIGHLLGEAYAPALASASFSFCAVAAPTIPSGLRAWAVWNAITAACVRGPKLPSGVPTLSLRAASTFWSATTAGPLSPILSLPPAGSVTLRDVDGGVACVCVGVVGCLVAGVVVVPGELVGGVDAFCGVGPTAAGLLLGLPPPEVAIASAIAVTTTSASVTRARIRRRRTIVSGPAGDRPSRRPRGPGPSRLGDR